jgi:hypothetical protein
MAEGSPKQRHGSAAFLLIIPGTTLIGVGIGLALQCVAPAGVTGLGVGSLLWGLLVEFRPSAAQR